MFYLYCDSIKDLCVLNAVWEILLEFASLVEDTVISSAESFLNLFRNYIKDAFSSNWLVGGI
jgi:hypothetical protein